MAENPVDTSQATGARYYYPDNKILVAEWADPAQPARAWWKVWLPIILVIVVLVAAALAAWFLWYAPLRNLKRATVMVLVDTDGDGQITPGEDGQGSGVIISPTGDPGYVLTCRHNLMAPDQTSCGKVEIWYLPGSAKCERLEATLEAAGPPGAAGDPEVGPTDDWAVLAVDRPGKLPYLRSASGVDLEEGEGIKCAGLPDRWDASAEEFGPVVQTVSGRVVGWAEGERNEFEPALVEYGTGLEEGMTGGPVVVGRRLLGMNQRVFPDEVGSHQARALPTAGLQDTVFDVYQK